MSEANYQTKVTYVEAFQLNCLEVQEIVALPRWVFDYCIANPTALKVPLDSWLVRNEALEIKCYGNELFHKYFVACAPAGDWGVRK